MAEVLGNTDAVSSAFHEASHVIAARTLGYPNAHIVSIRDNPHVDLGTTRKDPPYRDQDGLTDSGWFRLLIALAGLLGQGIYEEVVECAFRTEDFTHMIGTLEDANWTICDVREPARLLLEIDGREAVGFNDDDQVLGLLTRFSYHRAIDELQRAEERTLRLLVDYWDQVEELAQAVLSDD